MKIGANAVFWQHHINPYSIRVYKESYGADRSKSALCRGCIEAIQLLFRSGIVDPVEIITGGPDQAFLCVGTAVQRDLAFGMSGEALRGLRSQIRTAHGDEGVPEDMRGCTVQIDARDSRAERFSIFPPGLRQDSQCSLKNTIANPMRSCPERFTTRRSPKREEPEYWQPPQPTGEGCPHKAALNAEPAGYRKKRPSGSVIRRKAGPMGH